MVDWNERYRTEPQPWGGEPAALLPGLIEDLAPGSAIDLGCGEGRNARWLASLGWRVTAVDSSEQAIANARESDPEGRIRWTVADATTWHPEERVDLVLVSYLHLPAEALAALIRGAGHWLSPTGTMLYLGHARENLENGVGGPPDPSVLPTVALLAEAAAGLRVEQLHHQFRSTPKGRAIDVVLRARPW
ncbi:methyltransferase domain-containing protein [Hoyosella sp. G463]|uniref:Methyltransferase domain-containing protein n=1 Tax=Lolliginicoccus lacisalsi TaxID=2742202 RepID=A0A927JD82_9ACTN|nr:methyltransferase domain-containing protein [Lolliginicoccus lacisalsi]